MLILRKLFLNRQFKRFCEFEIIIILTQNIPDHNSNLNWQGPAAVTTIKKHLDNVLPEHVQTTLFKTNICLYFLFFREVPGRKE